MWWNQLAIYNSTNHSINVSIVYDPVVGLVVKERKKTPIKREK